MMARRQGTVVVIALTRRAHLRVTGVVQGVGFRPFVHRLAREGALGGFVGNDADGVFIEVEGHSDAIDAFVRRLAEDAPPLASVASITVTEVEPRGAGRPHGLDGTLAVGETDDEPFVIVASRAGGAVTTLVPPDVAICDDCRRELFDPGDRRYRHPFITCTNCGPRFTIVRSLPYDRPYTTMAGFPMCARCEAEYGDPTDRRFHAQPIACPDCGPALRYDPAGSAGGGDAATGSADDAARTAVGTEPALAAAQRCLVGGGIVAVKGVGGFHLACDATSEAAVALLRERKQRPHKPFAVMVADVATASAIARFRQEELGALTSHQRPVVLVPRRRRAGGSADGSVRPVVVEQVAPGNPTLGVMLPSTPLHELLLAPALDPDVRVPRALVMTSGNVSGEPMAFDDADARDRLGHLVDGFLTHDRPIHVPCDDGVVRSIGGELVPLRRSRGDAPLPIDLPVDAPPSLAVGAELKNTIGVATGRRAWLSQHIGDVSDLATLQTLERAVAQLTDLFDIDPEVVAADPHPAYATHAWARRHHAERLEAVQHHHAHVAAVLAEHGVAPDELVIGVAFDGTGFGCDDTVWGGEVLLADLASAQRVRHLAVVPLPGGDSAVTHPARMALAHLWAASLAWDDDLPCVTALTPAERKLLRRQLERGVAVTPTSSMGRLFDAVSSLLGVRQAITYEGQAAIELEWLADAAEDPGSGVGDAAGGASGESDLPVYRFPVTPVIDPGPVLAAIVRDVRAGVPPPAIAAAFHLAVAAGVAEVAAEVAGAGGPSTVALSGGVFQNDRLTAATRTALEELGFRVLTHRVVPPNDGGLALGQLAVVAARHAAAGGGGST
jgi:hydrogenase maturation protein HypF